MKKLAIPVSRVLGLMVGVYLLTGSMLAQSTQDSSRAMALTEHLDNTTVTQDANPEITLDLDQVPLEEALKRITAQVEAGLYYNAALLPEKTVDLRLKAVPLGEALRKVLEGTSLKVVTSGRNITLRQKREAHPMQLPMAPVQETITGTVTDGQSGETLPGVNILVKGTATGASTDQDGNFELEVPSLQDTLVVTYIGYQRQEVPINGRNQIDIQLNPEAIMGEEMVVVGYGVQRKSDLTGSVTTVGAEELEERPVSSVGQALQGNAPGVLVRTSSAAPGGGVSVTIRGHNSINSDSDPLYVVDGIPLENINNIPVETIKSVEVLKDASATAIYGSRGANGVILITTKKGRPGDTRISYSGQFTFERIPGDLNLMNAGDFSQIYTDWESTTDPSLTSDQLFYNGSSYERPSPDQLGKGTDWFNIISQDGFIQNHQLSVSGGSERSTYAGSLTFRDHKGLIKGGNYDRIGLKLSNGYDITDWLSSGLNLFLTRESKNSSGENVGLAVKSPSPISAATKMPPHLPIYNSDGGYQKNNLPSVQNMENPLAAALEYKNLNRDFRFIGNFNLTFKPFPGFSFKTSGGANIGTGNNYSYNPSNTIYGALVNGEAYRGSNNSSYFMTEGIATYKKDINQDSRINITAGFTYEQQTNEWFNASGTDFFTDRFLYNNLNAANNPSQPSSGKTQWQIASALGRINYALMDKYLFTMTGRYDGNSRFGIGNKWAFFPSFALAWRISNESFMENVNAISNLKLRASWGQVGNANIGLYQSLGTFGTANYPFGTTIQPGVAANNLPNPNLKWETTETTNLALDIGLFNRVDLTIEGYYKKTRDLLMGVSLIETSGFASALRNVGRMDNTGLEFDVRAKVINNGDFSWDINGGIYLNRNEIVELNGDASQEWKIGHPIGIKRMYNLEGIIRTQGDLDNYKDENGNPINGARLGDYKIQDVNNDGRISGDDLLILFDPNPNYTFSLRNEFSYKNFGLSIFVYGTQGNQIINKTSSWFTNLQQVRNNLSRDVLGNYWTPENTDAKYAALGSNSYTYAEERNIEDGSFLRLQNVTLSYNLPPSNVVRNASVYVSGQNLLLFTKYSGWDPDISSNSGNTNFGIDRAAYPRPRSLTIGIKASF